MFRVLFVVLLFLSLTLPALSAQEDALTEAGKRLHSELKGEFRTLRNFPSETVLNYDAAGRLKAKSDPSPWTLSGRIKVKRVEATPGNLHIEAERYLVVFKGRYGEEQKNQRTHEAVVIEADLPPSAGLSDLHKLVDAIFIPEAELLNHLPEFWREYLQQQSERVRQFRESPEGAREDGVPESTWTTNVSADPSQPVRIHQAQAEQLLVDREIPGYPLEVRAVRVEGSVVLDARVDTSGRVAELHLVKPLGAGLDDEAAEAISLWTFHTLAVGGVPREFLTYIRVNFTIRKERLK